MKNQVKILTIIIELVEFSLLKTKKRVLRFILEIIVRDGGYAREQILDSLTSRKYDDIMAFYLLLGLRTTEVRQSSIPMDNSSNSSRRRTHLKMQLVNYQQIKVSQMLQILNQA